MLASTSCGESGRPTGSVGFSRNARIRCRVGRVDVDDAELVGQLDRLPDRGDGAAGAGLDVRGHHLGEVHPVDVVGAHHDDDVGLLVGEQVERLVDRVRAAEVPPLADALLRRHRGDVVAEQVGHPPGRRDVPVEAVRLVLRQHDDLEVAGVDDVGQREVDEAVDPPERHRGLGPVGRQRHQALALTAGQDDGEDLLAGGCGTHATETSGARTARSTHCARVSSRSCESTCSARSTRPRSTAAPASTWPSWSVPSAPSPTWTHGCAASARRATRPARRRTPSRRRSRTPTARSAPSASTWRWSTTAPARTSCTRTPGTPTWPATSPASCTASRTWSARTRWSRCGRGRPSSSAAATPLSSWVERTAYEGAAGIIAVSAAMRDDVLRSYPDVDPARVHVVHNGIDTDRWSPVHDPDRVRELGVDPDRPSVIFVGRITRQKGLPLFLRAAAQLPPDVQLVLCAGAPDTPEIEAEVRGLVEGLAATRDRRRVDRGDAPARRRGRAADRGHRLRLPVDLRAARHRQPRGDGLRDRRRRHRHRRHPGGRRRRRRRGGWCRSSRPPTAPAPRSTPSSTSPTSPPPWSTRSATPTAPPSVGRAGRARAIEAFCWPAIAERTLEIYRSLA